MTVPDNTQPSSYQSTSTNMVHLIESIITGYKMGAIRALAQEPVQNSKDAKRSSIAKIEYRLHQRTLADGYPSHMLTITDSGTSGLGGPILNDEEIDKRGGVLNPGEDWSAFEGQGYTKANQDALGSRGQGKSASLYHSYARGTGQRRMVMLYDTLLPDGEYRLGVRYASPRDTVRRPPYLDETARELVSADAFTIDEGLGLEYLLKLNPLTTVGTRVIMPYLSSEAVEAFNNYELAKWLQMLWWRAIQVGEIEISLVDTHGASRKIGVPKWWRSQFWNASSTDENQYVKTNIYLKSDPNLKIKRLALQYDENLEAHQHLYDQSEPEYDGIQIMRGLQWIETLGAKQEYSQQVPEERRAGFRGFVEFERDLDRELRSAEYERPQHDSYNRRKGLIREIRDELASCVKEFSERQGWVDEDVHQEDASERERQIASRALSVLVNPPKGKSAGSGNDHGGTAWGLDIQVDYPNPKTTRVDWGQKLSRIYVRCQTEPKRDHGSVTLKIMSVDPDNKRQEIATKRAYLGEDGAASAEFGDLLVMIGKSDQQHMSCPGKGKYRLYATVSDAGTDLKRASRAVYVQEDPPEPPDKKTITLSVKVSNLEDPERARINNGERLRVDVSVKNRSDQDAVLHMNASLVASELPPNLVPGIDAPISLSLATKKKIKINGIERSGEPPVVKQLISKPVRLFNDIPDSTISQAYLVASPGTHDLHVNIYGEHMGEEIKISTSRRIHFEVDPPGNAGKMPFELIRQETTDESREAAPIWRLESPEKSDASYPLYYSPQHHIYRIAERADKNAKTLSEGANAVIREIIADAYLDWMHEAHRTGDDSRYDTILERSDQAENLRWRRLAEQVEEFQRMSDSEDIETERLAELRRQIVANLVCVFEEAEA